MLPGFQSGAFQVGAFQIATGPTPVPVDDHHQGLLLHPPDPRRMKPMPRGTSRIIGKDEIAAATAEFASERIRREEEEEIIIVIGLLN